MSGKQYLKMSDVIEGIQHDSLVEVIQRGLMNKEYLKMADAFVHDSVEALEQHIYAGYMSKHCCEYAAHAINSHDELVRQRDQLLASLKDLLSSKEDAGLFAGVMAADNAAKLIKSIEDSKWAGSGHSPDAAPKLGGE